MKWIKNEVKLIRKTFSGLNKEFFLVMLFETFYFLTVYLLRDPTKALDIIAAKEMEGIVFDTASILANPLLLEANIGLLKMFIFKMIMVFLGFFILHSILYSIFNYLSWHRMAAKNFDLEHAKGFVKISAIWVFLWMTLFAGALFIFDPSAWVYVFFVFMFLFLHMTTMLNIVLIHNKKHCDVNTIIGKTFRMSFHKLPHVWAPYSSGVVIVTVIGIALIYIINNMPILTGFRSEILLFYFIAFITWWRTHLYNSLKHHTTRV